MWVFPYGAICMVGAVAFFGHALRSELPLWIALLGYLLFQFVVLLLVVPRKDHD